MSDTDDSTNQPSKETKPSQSSSSLGSQGATPIVNSEDLLRGSREMLIRHRGEIYRLLETRNGKLILQK